MRILYICGEDPQLTTSGSRQRTHFLWKALQRIGEVTVCCPPPRPNEFFLRLTKLLRWPIRDEQEVRRYLGIDGTRFDAVVVRYMNRCTEFAAWKLGPLYIDIDDVPLQAFDSIEKYRLPWALRGCCRMLLKVAMRYVFKRCAGVWIVKNEDVRYLPNRLPFGVLRNLANPPSEGYVRHGLQEKLVMTVGMMGYAPNHRGVTWFVENIWPEIHRRHPEYVYVVAGRDAPDVAVQKWRQVNGVEVLGFVENLDDLYARASVVVAPILSGAGTCIKVMESCLRGRKTLVTACAARGYEGEDAVGLQLGVFSDLDSFDREFSSWTAMSEDARVRIENEIALSAGALNSFDNMVETVRRMICKG